MFKLPDIMIAMEPVMTRTSRCSEGGLLSARHGEFDFVVASRTLVSYVSVATRDLMISIFASA
jgi:hypothetical protein